MVPCGANKPTKPKPISLIISLVSIILITIVLPPTSAGLGVPLVVVVRSHLPLPGASPRLQVPPGLLVTPRLLVAPRLLGVPVFPGAVGREKGGVVILFLNWAVHGKPALYGVEGAPGTPSVGIVLFPGDAVVRGPGWPLPVILATL